MYVGSMDFAGFPLHLTSSELDYELRIRGVQNLANNREKTAALRDLLRKEKSGQLQKPTGNGDVDVHAELVVCQAIYNDVANKAEEACESRNTAELVRCESRLLHVQQRLTGLRPVEDESASNVHGLLDCVADAHARVSRELTVQEKNTGGGKSVNAQSSVRPPQGGQLSVAGRMASLQLRDVEDSEGAVGGDISYGGGESLSDMEFMSVKERREFRQFARDEELASVRRVGTGDEGTRRQDRTPPIVRHSDVYSGALENGTIDEGVIDELRRRRLLREELGRHSEIVPNNDRIERVQNNVHAVGDRTQHASIQFRRHTAVETNPARAHTPYISERRNNTDHFGTPDHRPVHTNAYVQRPFVEQGDSRRAAVQPNAYNARMYSERGNNEVRSGEQGNPFVSDLGRSALRFDAYDRRPANINVRNNVRKSVPINQWKITFSGDGLGLHLYDFLSQVSLFQRSECVADEEMVFSVIHLLSGRAKLWFLSVCDLFGEWADVVQALKREFLPANYDYLLFNDITNRQQQDNESFASYITHMQALFKCLSVPVDESHKLFIVQKNLLPRYALAIAPLELRNLAELNDACRRIDNACALTNRNTYSMPFSQSGAAVFAVQQNHVAPQQFARPNQHTEGRSVGKCWNCQLTGHSHRECTQPRSGVFCYRYGTRGVITNRCTKCSGNGAADPEVSGPRDSAQN